MKHIPPKVILEPSQRQIMAKKLLDELGIDEISKRIEALDEIAKLRHQKKLDRYRDADGYRYNCSSDWTEHRTDEEESQLTKYVEAVKIYQSPDLAHQRIIERKQEQKRKQEERRLMSMMNTNETTVSPSEIDDVSTAEASPMDQLEAKLDTADEEIVMVRTAMWFPIITIIMSTFFGFIAVIFAKII